MTDPKPNPNPNPNQRNRALPKGNDPRKNLDPEDLEKASTTALPAVASRGGSMDWGMMLGIIGAVGLGLLTLSLNPQPSTQPAQTVSQTPAPTPQPSTLPPIDPTIQAPLPEPSGLIDPLPEPVPPQPQPQTQSPAVASDPRSPALIVDLSMPVAVENQATPAGGGLLNKNESFGAKLTSESTARAVKGIKSNYIVAQGTLIPAVLETAINSDLPGFTRAVVSRDVRSSDGTIILIPKGSHLLGQYKSGLTSGETRAFIIWSRLIRPDGVSVDLVSPAIDPLGQAGMSGKVDNHFLKRFGSAILLTSLNALAQQGANGSNTIVIGTSQGVSQTAASTLSADSQIPPTIKVAHGTAISVFTARDLDFTVLERP
jgi:type IV secretion system protein VirB10